MELFGRQAGRPVVVRVDQYRQSVVCNRQLDERYAVLSREFALGVLDWSGCVGDDGLASGELLEASAGAGDADWYLYLWVFLAEVFSSGYCHGGRRLRNRR